MTSDAELLRRYALERAEPAFEEFVRRNLPMVYSAALRTLAGDTHAAEDVTQVVFCTTARQAQRLSQHPSLNAWLHTATRNAAIALIRAERRRRTREQEAHSMPDQPIDITSAADW